MAKETKTKEDLVEVSMTQEQKDAFVQFQLTKEREAKDKADSGGFVQMTLANKHTFGRNSYGPGVARIPDGLAGQIAWQEQKANGRELALNTSNKKLVKILQSGQQIPIKVD